MNTTTTTTTEAATEPPSRHTRAERMRLPLAADATRAGCWDRHASRRPRPAPRPVGRQTCTQTINRLNVLLTRLIAAGASTGIGVEAAAGLLRSVSLRMLATLRGWCTTAMPKPSTPSVAFTECLGVSAAQRWLRRRCSGGHRVWAVRDTHRSPPRRLEMPRRRHQHVGRVDRHNHQRRTPPATIWHPQQADPLAGQHPELTGDRSLNNQQPSVSGHAGDAVVVRSGGPPPHVDMYVDVKTYLERNLAMAPRRLFPNPALGVTGDGIQPAAPAPSSSRRKCTLLNSDFPWDEFDSSWYYTHNYKVLRDDDRQIIEVVRDFFATLEPLSLSNGIDVGSGPNLYPALTMLPLCDKVTLYEYAASNVAWLQHEIRSYSSSWNSFWDLLAQEPLYKAIDSPREALAAKASVERGSVFKLPDSRWDIGTMFFTAESISSTPSEFRVALQRFIRSLRSGAPFVAAFMENSRGYTVGTRSFPAVAITVKDVEDCLAENTENIKIHSIGLTDNPLRAGYAGMILVTGNNSIAKS